MSTALSDAGALPATGSGPFTFVLGVVGIVAVAVGALLRRVARRPAPAAPVVTAPTSTHADRFGLDVDLSTSVA